MFLVGGGILTHGLPFLHSLTASVAQLASTVPALTWMLEPVLTLLLDAVTGIAAGTVALGLVALAKRAYTSTRNA